MTLIDDSSLFPVHPTVVETVARNLPDSIWTQKNIDRLKELIAEELTTSQIAAVLTQENKIRVSRNAIIGKARRLDISLLGKSTRRAKPRASKPKNKTLNTLTKVKSPPITAPTPPTLAEVVANPKNLTILDIQRGECYWPTTLEGATVFCGHSTGSTEKSWCPAHSKLGYAPPYYRQRIGT